MACALGNLALILLALGLLNFVEDPGALLGLANPLHGQAAFTAILLAVLGAAAWLNSLRFETPARLLTSWMTGGVAIAIAGLQAFGVFQANALSYAPGQPAVQTSGQSGSSATAESPDIARSYGSVEIPAASNGNFYAKATVNGQPVTVLIDTGASYVALRYEDAEALGLDPLNLDYTIELRTANGKALGAEVELDDVTVAGITVNDVKAIVSQQHALGITLLGMSYLSRTGGFKVAGDKLILGE